VRRARYGSREIYPLGLAADGVTDVTDKTSTISYIRYKIRCQLKSRVAGNDLHDSEVAMEGVLSPTIITLILEAVNSQQE